MSPWISTLVLVKPASYLLSCYVDALQNNRLNLKVNWFACYNKANNSKCTKAQMLHTKKKPSNLRIFFHSTALVRNNTHKKGSN